MTAWMGGQFGGEWIRVCITESLCCLPETIITLLIVYTPKQSLKKQRQLYEREKKDMQMSTSERA